MQDRASRGKYCCTRHQTQEIVISVIINKNLAGKYPAKPEQNGLFCKV